MTHVSKLLAAALLAAGVAAQAPAQAALPPLAAVPAAGTAAGTADASGPITLAMGRGAGIRCVLPAAASDGTLDGAADEAEADPTFAPNPTAPRTIRADCPTVPSAEL